ncbi:BTAD domain-containing putative transcriptional regulator [Streptomyces sp. NPDC096193]|uniref:AfsR/SARP family transcriptional regulator n=1 Tax=Streptomyces sp. NPDC096193 TaxID=3155821 RepID=UPI0033348F0D
MQVTFGVLGPVVAWDRAGDAIELKGPRHRAVLARLIVARRRVVPVGRLVEDLWADPPPGAVGAVRTFVSALRRGLEPQRPPRTPARLLVTQGPGYALRAEHDAVDAWRFDRAVTTAATLPPEQSLALLDEALAWWRGPAYAEFPDEPWTRTERSRLAELRLQAAESRAETLLALGAAARAVSDLDAHVGEHPWREDAWRLLTLALYRSGRQGDALTVLRRARTLLVEQLGVDPGPRLRRLEADIRAQAPHLDPAAGAGGPAGRVWAEAAADYDRTVGPGARARLESTVSLLRNLAVTSGGGLQTARRHRVAAIAAAEESADAELIARVIGAYDVPAIWPRVDDPEQAAQVVAAAERTLAALPEDAHPASRARLLATIALETRGTVPGRRPDAARQAEEIARRLDDPALLAFALNAVFMQSFDHTGLAGHRARTGDELVALAARHGLATYEVLGHLIGIQARSALGDFEAADRHATAADRLAERHELPLVGVFTQWYRALRLDETGEVRPTEVEAAYRAAAARLDGAGMPGLEHGLLPLTLLCLRLRTTGPAPADDLSATPSPPAEDRTDWGPYEPWTRPLVLLAQERRDEAAAALSRLPDPPRDLLCEALWCLAARAALALGDLTAMERAYAQLLPAAGELAGAGSGMLTLGPVARYLDALAAALGHTR